MTAEVTPTLQNLIKALKQKTIVIHRRPQEDREREKERAFTQLTWGGKEVTVKRETRKCLYKGAHKYAYEYSVCKRDEEQNDIIMAWPT